TVSSPCRGTPRRPLPALVGVRAWVRDFYRELYGTTGGVPVPNEVTDGCFVNYADVDLNDPAWNSSGVAWHDLYYKGNYPWLRRVKARWDPRDVFRHAQSIQPAGRLTGASR
ncbi:BBE domain-containing protein, partial [Micromonospora sp. ATCC 39149]